MRHERQRLRVAAINRVNDWVHCYRLEAAAQAPLAAFEAGQYLNLFYEINGSTTSRPYSIASSPGDAEKGFYELYIHGGGPFTSRWLFEHIKPGDELWASLPMGEFHTVPERDGKKIIGISGGMSVTPLRAMARAVVEGSLDAELTLFCGWDKADEILYREEFEAYAAASPRFKAVFAVAEGAPDCESGYVDLAMIRSHVQPEGAAFFLCGPQAMYEALRRALAPLKIPAEKYHQELPGEIHSPDGLEGYPGTGAEDFALNVTCDGAVHEIKARGSETVLVALERAGMDAEARCRSGVCGFCGSLLTGGEVFVPARWDTRTQEERARGLIHPCCSFPLTDLALTLPVDSDEKK